MEHHSQPGAVRETHIGLVLLVGDRAYKTKKPVRTAFLDFSTPQRRFAALRRELELNRRLAPDAYLGIAQPSPPTLDDNPTSEAAEPVLVMRRMPDDRRLAALARSGADVHDDLRALARLLVAFHARAERSAETDADGDRAALGTRWKATSPSWRRVESGSSPLPYSNGSPTWHAGSSPGAARCWPTGSPTAGSSTDTATSSPRTCSACLAAPGRWAARPRRVGRGGRLVELRHTPRPGRRAGPSLVVHARRVALRGHHRHSSPPHPGPGRRSFRRPAPVAASMALEADPWPAAVTVFTWGPRSASLDQAAAAWDLDPFDRTAG